MPVEQRSSGVAGAAGAGEHDGMAGGLDDLALEPDRRQFVGKPRGGAANVRRAFRVVGNRGDRDQFEQFGNRPIEIVVDVAKFFGRHCSVVKPLTALSRALKEAAR